MVLCEFLIDVVLGGVYLWNGFIDIFRGVEFVGCKVVGIVGFGCCKIGWGLIEVVLDLEKFCGLIVDCNIFLFEIVWGVLFNFVGFKGCFFFEFLIIFDRYEELK